jgi:ABC-type dipeptide/oligopeptide/nickel transport system permease subunit
VTDTVIPRTRPFWRRSIVRRRGGVTKSIWRQPLTIAGLVVLAAWLIVAIAAPLIAPYNPLTENFKPLLPPSAQHLFGTDDLGRDVLSRVIYGARVSLPLSLLLVSLSVVIGSTLGAIAGYFRGWIDGVLMRLCDLLFAFPAIVLAMVVTATIGPSITHAIIALVFISWPWYARIVRGLVMSIADTDYVTANRLLGASVRQALTVDVLPNVVGPILVLATLDLGGAVLLLSALSFLGLGAQPPMAEWGAMVSEGIQYFTNWWIGAFPGLAIFSVVLAFNLVGDSLRDYFDPQTVGNGKL